MKNVQIRSALGLLMIAAGVLFLLQSLGYLEGAGTLFWTLVFAAAGGVFLYVFFLNREQWWALIPGFTLIGLGALIALDQFIPRWGGALGGTVLMLAISLSFWVIYFQQREHWWAIIPGGVLLSLGIFIGLEEIFTGVDLVGIFFLGMGLTFVLVAMLPEEREKMRWAFIPAGVLLLMGVIFTATAFSAFEIVGPAALIIVGAYLVFRTFSPRLRA
jgi:hypothetical protein